MLSLPSQRSAKARRLRASVIRRSLHAFSLLEMMTVLALLLIFASFALPIYQNIVLRTREPTHRERRAGTNFYLDRADDLIDGYALLR
jgi:prepilin-type N-terminal cleavage/methylation domain-containing protein